MSPVRSLLVLFALAAPATRGAAQISLPFDRCGTLIEGVECAPMFQEDSGCIWILEDYGGLGVGARVHVTGVENHDLGSFCQQECGHVLSNTIGPCFDDFTTPYCFGFFACPCGNPSFGGGCANATGSGASLEPTAGSADVVSDDLVLTVAGMQPGEFGIIFMGAGQTQLPFGDGVRCVAGGATGLFRYPPQASTGAGELHYGPGLAAFSAGQFGPLGAIQPGSTWEFQGWYRDPNGPCSSSFNLTNGLEVVFQ